MLKLRTALLLLFAAILAGCTFRAGPLFVAVDFPDAGGMIATQEGQPLPERTPVPTVAPLPTMTPTNTPVSTWDTCLVVPQVREGIRLRVEPSVSAVVVGSVSYGSFVPVDRFVYGGAYLWAHDVNAEAWFVVHAADGWWVGGYSTCSGVEGYPA